MESPIHSQPKPAVSQRSPYMLAIMETSWPVLMAIVTGVLLYVVFAVVHPEVVYFIVLVIALTILITTLTLLYRSNLKRIKREQDL